jgi:outer membrane lipoprotein-sorting protein
VKKNLLALAAAALVTSAAPVMTAQAAPAVANLPATDRAALNAASAYLQNLTSARGRFVQTDPNGQVSQGTFYLQRPGKIRFEYDAPSRMLVVADGSNINVHDPRLKTFRRYPQGSTPLSLFLGRTINLETRAVTSVTRSAGGVAISARDPKNPRSGYITIGFSGSPLRLSEWTVVDPQNRKTRVRITSMTQTSNPASLFTLRNPNAG